MAGRRPPPNDDEPAPELVTVQGRQWIHLDGTDSKFGGAAGESYGTLIQSNLVFSVSATYWQNIRKDAVWFESRRALLRSIRDEVSVQTQ